MPSNTRVVVGILAIFACILIVVRVAPDQTKRLIPSIPSSHPTIPTPTPIQVSIYRNDTCGVSFQYLSSYMPTDATPTTIIFTNKTGDVVTLICQADIPDIALSDSQIESVTYKNTPAKLYHDVSQTDGKAIDKLILSHPSNGLRIYIAGLGDGFNRIVSTLRLLP